MKKIELIQSPAQELDTLETIIKLKATKEKPLRILEAGCGRSWPLDIKQIKCHITGVDLDQHALKIRQEKFNDLDEYLIGDLNTIDFKNNSFDVIYNSFVLEHTQQPENVLKYFFKWLDHGGLLILRIPDRNSVYGFCTRITPFSFHLFYKKHILGFLKAGEKGFGPYPTFDNVVLSRRGIHEFCKKNQLKIKYEFGRGFYIKGKSKMKILIRIFVIMLSVLSLNKLNWQYDSLTYIIEKN